MDDLVDVAVVGAGPYGLSLAAHLRAAGATFRQFGHPMRLWRQAMPRGMFLKSQGFASNLSDPAGTHTLRVFCETTGRPYADYGLPVPLETFVDYGRWFQREQVPELEEVLVTDVTPAGEHYELTLGSGERARARTVVVAAGVEHFAHVPDVLAGLPPEMCSHPSAHPDLATFCGQEVLVVGAGQSALESAALLREGGAQVRVVVRGRRVVWNGEPLPTRRTTWQHIREPEAALGSGWATWFYSSQPSLFRSLPPGTRAHRALTALGPAGAAWLRPRFEGVVPTLLGYGVRSAVPDGSRVRLDLAAVDGSSMTLTADHVIAATGYRTDLSRLSFLKPELAARVRTRAGSPVVGRDFGSSVPGLHFVGPAVAPSFGPVMRFVFGADYAARVVARRLAGVSTPHHPVGVAR